MPSLMLQFIDCFNNIVDTQLDTHILYIKFAICEVGQMAKLLEESHEYLEGIVKEKHSFRRNSARGKKKKF